MKRREPARWAEVYPEVEEVLASYEPRAGELVEALRPLVKDRFWGASFGREALVFERGALPPRVRPVEGYAYEKYVSIGKWYFVFVVRYEESPLLGHYFQECARLSAERDRMVARILDAM